MQTLIKLTESSNGSTILIGTESIISVEEMYSPNKKSYITKIRSRGAMVETFYVIESVEEVFNLYNL